MKDDRRFVEHDHLVNESYRNRDKLDARRQIYRFLKSDQSFPEWMLGHLDGPFGRVLDVGCGPGFYMGKARPRADLVVGIDLSAGMLQEAKEISSLVAVADAEYLPFGTGIFDTTLCLHMLYHVADIPAAVAELRRVTQPDGRTVVVTNGADHMRQLRDDFDSIVEEIARGSVESVLSEPRRFRMEDGEKYLQGRFSHVRRYDMRSSLEVTEAEAIDRYLESIRSFHEPKLPESISWDVVMSRFLEHAGRSIVRDGAYRITTHPGMFICK